jgi:chromosome segregation ATPase
MTQDTISKIEERIHNSSALSAEHRAELLKLVGQLRGEITALSRTHQERAENIASLAEASTREATRATRNPEQLQHSIGGLQSSVEGFETSHPQLSALVNRIASLLANMGI